MKAMIKIMMQGVSMALADSVPGVSGGTIAFILGFYEEFMGALHGIFHKDSEVRKKSILYILKFAAGWVISMAACVILLSNIFNDHIYFLSSLFLGFTVAAIPFIVYEERRSILQRYKYIVFTFIGAASVVLLTVLRTSSTGIGFVDFQNMNIQQYGYLFIAGAAAVSAMLLPGISGSTLLLILGVYIPTINAVKQVMYLHIQYMPGIISIGVGVLFGIFFAARMISSGLRRFRPQMVYLIIGLLIGSLYAITMGPTTLSVPKEAMSLGTFNVLAFLVGIMVLTGLEYIRFRTEHTEKAKAVISEEAKLEDKGFNVDRKFQKRAYINSQNSESRN